MKNKWIVTIDGNQHEIIYKPGFIKGKRTVDGVGTVVKNTNWFIRLFDEAFELDGKTLHLTAIGNKVDLAVDGVYVDSKKPYAPFKTVPSWVNIVSGILLLSGMFTGGYIGMLIGAIFGILMITQSVSPKRDNPKPICIGLAAIALILQFLYLFMIMNLK